MPEEEYEKILFQFYSNVLDEQTIETMWAIIIDKEKGLYKLDSIPFYTPNVAADDIIYAEFDEDQERLTYRYMVEPSCNSTVQVVIMKSDVITNEIREAFDSLGYSSEKCHEGYFVIDVPHSLNLAGTVSAPEEYPIEVYEDAIVAADFTYGLDAIGGTQNTGWGNERGTGAYGSD